MVKVALPILRALVNSGLNNITLRGEVFGMGFRGSGVSCNPYKNDPAKFKLFSVEKFDDKRKIWERVTLEESVGLAYCLNITFVPFIGTIKPASLEDLIKACNMVFESHQIADNVIIEGVVIRSMGETKYSRKILNPEYDSKK